MPNQPDAIPADLPAPVAAALAAPGEGRRIGVDASGIPWSAIEWGEGDRHLLLVHGITSSARAWWRVGPALAADGWRVVAVDLPGHGLTGHWTGHHRFRDNAADLATFVRAAGLLEPARTAGVSAGLSRGLAIVGHSWGAMTVAALPLAGLCPELLVLMDPPDVPLGVLAEMVDDPVERRYDTIEEAVRVLRAAYPDWPDGDVEAKAEGLTQFDEDSARAVLLDNGDWDGGLAAISDPAAAGLPVWIIRGDPTAGGLMPDPAAARLAAVVGPDHVLTIAGAPHSPQRTHPEATIAALLRALS